MTTKKIWDTLTKELMQAGPQDLISWIFPNATYVGELNTELLKEPVRADQMYTVTWEGVPMGFHIEFQKRHDTNMGRRVWRYNALASDRTELPIYSAQFPKSPFNSTSRTRPKPASRAIPNTSNHCTKYFFGPVFP